MRWALARVEVEERWAEKLAAERQPLPAVRAAHRSAAPRVEHSALAGTQPCGRATLRGETSAEAQPAQSIIAAG
jgi:hypothetical protein